MTQWEYAIGVHKDKVFKANGDDVSSPVLITFLQEMGGRGWELASVVFLGVGGTTYYFKRPKVSTL